MKKIKPSLAPVNLTAVLAVSLFLILALSLAGLAAFAWLGIDRGWLQYERLVNPLTVAVTIFLICLLLSIAILTMLRKTMLNPLREMLASMTRLAGGDFAVRMDVGGKMRPTELRLFAEAFNTAAQELGSTELLRKDFINNFSHEFRTPITSIGGFADLILSDDEMPPEEEREYLQIISSESRRLSTLTNQILALSRVESQTILSDIVTFPLAEQLRQTVLLLGQKWASKNVELRLEAAECEYSGNELLLKEVWVNLLDNAYKFSDDGGVITLTLRQDAERVTVSVQDEGPGMDAQVCAHVFDQFYQGDHSHRTQGNGLGLTMAKKITELHRGNITVESKPGQGSIFTVSLPK